MIHPKSPSSTFIPQQKKRTNSNSRNSIRPVQPIQIDQRPTATVAPTVPSDVEETETLGFFEAIEHERAQAEMAKMLAKKKIYPIAPDGFIPNSILRSMFRIKEVEPVEMKMFRLRLIPSSTNNQMDIDEGLERYAVLTDFNGLHSTIFQALHQIDILDNLQSKTNRNLNWQNDDDEWVELADPEASFARSNSKPDSAKKSRIARSTTETMVSRLKDELPEIFKRMKKEPWWGHADEDGKNNLRAMLLYLIDVLREKDRDSYESACNYVVEIFRTYGIEPNLLDQIFDIFTDHLALSENDPLDVHTIRALAQFMMERKNVIIALLAFTSKCQPNDLLRQEAINAVKFITDVNSTDDIDLALNNMPVVRDAAADTFSLKMIIQNLRAKQKKAPSDLSSEGGDEGEGLHPLLRKISEERWFPRDNNPITLDSVIDAILAKLPNASKTMLKALTTHLIHLHRMFGYSNEQFDRVFDGLISLLAHNDADYRLIASTVLASLDKETKAVDIALLNSFLNDPRILVRTECCESLKKLTGVMSETVLKDCADDIPYLQTLSEENFSLQNYLREKNRLPTPPNEQPAAAVDEMQEQQEEHEDIEIVDQEQAEEQKTISIHADESDLNIDDSNFLQDTSVTNQATDVRSFVPSGSTSPRYEEPTSIEKIDHTSQILSKQVGVTPNSFSPAASATPIAPAIRVEINEKSKSSIALARQPTQPRKEISEILPPPPPPSSQPHRGRRQMTEPFNRTFSKMTLADQSTGRRHLLLPNNTQMWDSYAKQDDMNEELESEILPPGEFNQEPSPPDPIQTILDDHKRHMGYYRSMPNRRVLIPHKISFDDVFADQTHLTLNRKTPVRTSPHTTISSNTMQLSDLNRNKRHLHEVEFVQLLSSLIIRAIQIHRQYERFIPGPFAIQPDSYANFTDALSISQIQLHSPTSLDHNGLYSLARLPPIPRNRPSSAEMARMKTHTNIRAKRAGLNLRKAQDMEEALSYLLTTDRVPSRSTLAPANTPHPATLVSHTDPNNVTHAWLLEQLLKAHGAANSPNYIHQIIRTYPKFTPLLHARVPRDLVPIIWNDPVMKRLAAIVSNKPEDSSNEEVSSRRVYTKPSVPTFDDEHSSNFFDHATSSQLSSIQQQQRDEQRRKHLPPILGTKMRLPRHVLKFGFRELEPEPTETTVDSLRDETISKARRRRIYMHLMMSVNENMLVRHELVKNQYRHMLKTDYRSASFLPIISKPSECN